jgi:4-diphosphocytidyl-2-C-methyl-D-erythritol kinase
MLFFPNSKINIGLNVTAKRPDGYHNIETIFCPIGLTDVLEFVHSPGSPDGQINFTASGIEVDCLPGSNLCVKAYKLLHGIYTLPAIDVHLHKIVPAGAGLGGGSSDGAFMLKELNRTFNLGLDEDTLCRYASQLGSDCAFFIKNRPLWGYGRGDQFREVPDLPEDLEVVVICPGIHVSSSEAYAGVTPAIHGESLEKLISLPVETWKNQIVNDFEKSVISKYPVIGVLKSKLYEIGAAYASMSGSGSSVYGLFRKNAPEVEGYFPGMFCWKGGIAGNI